MRRLVAIMLALAMLFGVNCLAEGKLSVTQKNLIIYDGDDNGYFYAKVENTGDAPIGIGTGKLVAFSPDDEIVLSENYVSAYPGRVILAPGECAYAKEFIWDSAVKDQEISDYKFSMDTYDYGQEVVYLPCEAEISLKGADTFDNYVYVTFTNTTEKTIYGLTVTVAMTGEAGELLFVDGSSAETLGVHAGSTVTLKLYVDNDLMEYYDAHDLHPTTVDATVCYSAD